MRQVMIGGVECFVFIEAFKLDKGVTVNVLRPIDPSLPVEQREYVNYRIGFIPSENMNDARKRQIRKQGWDYYSSGIDTDPVARDALERAIALLP